VGKVRLVVNDCEVFVQRGSSVAAALHELGILSWPDPVTGRLRGPFCGMGVCFECELQIDGRTEVRSCMVTVADGMRIETVR